MNSKNIIFNTLKEIREILPSQFKRRTIIVTVLAFVNSFLELIGLASLIPLFNIIFKNNIIKENETLFSIYNFFGFSSENQFIIFIAVSILSIIIIKNIMSLLIIKYQATFSFDIMKYFILQFYSTFYKKGYLFFKNNDSNIIYRDTFDIPQLFSRSILMGTVSLFNELIVLVLIVISIVWYDVNVLILLLLVVAPIFLIFYSITKRKLQAIGIDSNNITPKIAEDIRHSSFGFVDVVITGTYDFFDNRLHQNVNIYKDLNINRVTLNYAPSKLIECIMIFAIFIVIIYGIYFLPDKASLLSLLGVYAIVAYRVMPSINRIMIAVNSLIENYFVFDIIKQIDIDKTQKTFEHKKINFNKEITLDNISFQYNNKKAYILQNFNLTITKGDIIGIKGSSGSGKTTLMNILLGFLIPTSGKINVDSVQLNDATLKSWQEKIGYVQQEVFLLNTTIAENIAFGLKKQEIDYPKLLKSIKLASLQSFVDSLSNGVETIVGERGTQLSGGQKQRIGIARALYFDSEILFFDEATSALDNQTEKEITEAISNLSSYGLTMIIIAHRESSLKNAKKIIDLSER